MLGDRLLQLAWPHLQAARLDQILLPIDDVQITVGIEIPEVARVHPRFAGGIGLQHDRRFTRIAPIATHQLRRAHKNFAGLAGGHQFGWVIDVHDLQLHIGQRDAHGTEARGRTHRRGGGRHQGLGERVRFEDAHTGDRFPASARFFHQGRGAAHTHTQGGKVDSLVLHIFAREHGGVQRRHAHEIGWAHFVERRHEIVEVAGVRNDRNGMVPDQRRALHGTGPIRMKHRQWHKEYGLPTPEF